MLLLSRSTLRLHLVVIAKESVPGRVKTRLCPPYTPVQAAELAAASLADTLAAVAATPVQARTLALDGATGPWLPAGFHVIPQRGAGLDERLAGALDDAYRREPLPLLLVGMDTPQVSVRLLTAAGRTLLDDGVDAVIGPATDGGFWALGLRHPDERLLLGVPMSRASTGAEQLRRLEASGLRVAQLPTLTDVDTAADAELVAGEAPSSRFAAALWRLARTA